MDILERARTRTLLIVATDGNDRVHLNGQGRHGLQVHTDFYLGGKHKTFSTADIDRIVVELLGGDDHLTTAGNVHIPLLARAGSGNNHIQLAGGPAVVVGGVGNDDIKGGAGRNVLIGGLGSNTLRTSNKTNPRCSNSAQKGLGRPVLLWPFKAGRGGEVLVGGATQLDDDDDALFHLLDRWNSSAPLADRVDDLIDALAGQT